MIGNDDGFGKARDLRDAFDRAFADKPEAGDRDERNFIAISVAGNGYAVALEEISGLFLDKRIVALPGRAAGFLGVAGLRGAIVPVYGLGALLELTRAAGTPRWLMVTASRDPVAFGFDGLDTYLKARKEQISGADDSVRQSFVRAMVHAGGTRRPVISILTAADSIKRQFGTGETRT